MIAIKVSRSGELYLKITSPNHRYSEAVSKTLNATDLKVRVISRGEEMVGVKIKQVQDGGLILLALDFTNAASLSSMVICPI